MIIMIIMIIIYAFIVFTFMHSIPIYQYNNIIVHIVIAYMLIY